MSKIEFNEMIKLSTVKECDEYVPGIYNNRKPIHGAYIKAIENTILVDIEIMAKGMFKLEKDPENYVQDARMETILALDKFYNKFGYGQDEKFIKSWVYQVVKRKLMDNARKARSNVYIYDTNEKVFSVNTILSIDKLKEDDNGSFEDLECDIYELYKNRDSSNEFIKWFHNNKEKFLTKRQLDFINNDNPVEDKGNASKIKRKIYNSITNEYGEYQIEYFKEKNKQLTYEKINNILDSFDEDNFEEFINECADGKCRVYHRIIDRIYEDLHFNFLKDFTKCLNGIYVENNRMKIEIINILNNLLKKW